MRDIKFRVWHIKNKHYYYFGLKDLDGDYIMDDGVYFEDCEDPEEYIGRKDINGNGIYKHDNCIISYNDGGMELVNVIWGDESCSYYFKDNKGVNWCIGSYKITEIEIVGNIHE